MKGALFCGAAQEPRQRSRPLLPWALQGQLSKAPLQSRAGTQPSALFLAWTVWVPALKKIPAYSPETLQRASSAWKG